MTFPRFLLIALLALGMAGCIDVDTVVQVSADGSGTVRERVLVSRTLTAPLRAMTEGLGRLQGGDPPLEPFSVLDRERLARRAERMGAGVSLVAADPVEDETGEGYVARYRFPDVTRLRINQNPGDRAPLGGGMGAAPAGEELVTFGFEPGPTPELRVRMPRKAGPEAQPEGAPPEPPGGPAGEAMLAKAREWFRGLRVAVAVEVAGEILETNASYRDGRRVVLMELDFSELLRDTERLEALAQRRPRSLEEAKEWLRDLPGVKVETEPEVRIRFQGEGLRVTAAPRPVTG